MHDPFDPARIAEARELIASHERRLMEAERIFARNRLAVCDLNATRAMLRRVRHWKNDGDTTVTLAFGFLGKNGWGCLVDYLCDLAARESDAREAA